VVILAKEFHTSRVTIQRALQMLVVEGVVFSCQGSGTYVRKNTLDQPTFEKVNLSWTYNHRKDTSSHKS